MPLSVASAHSARLAMLADPRCADVWNRTTHLQQHHRVGTRKQASSPCCASHLSGSACAASCRHALPHPFRNAREESQGGASQCERAPDLLRSCRRSRALPPPQQEVFHFVDGLLLLYFLGRGRQLVHGVSHWLLHVWWHATIHENSCPASGLDVCNLSFFKLRPLFHVAPHCTGGQGRGCEEDLLCLKVLVVADIFHNSMNWWGEVRRGERRLEKVR